MTVSRRDLLGQASKFIILTSAASAAFEAMRGSASADTTRYQAAQHWWGMSVDIEKCIGCGNCVRACAKENDVPDGFFRTWIERYQVPHHSAAVEEHPPKVESPKGGIEGFPPVAEQGLKSFFVPKLCNHCADSPCVQVCPVGATFESPDGVVLVDQNYCIGCRYCVQACPYGCRYIHPTKHTVDKCTLCYHRITKGLTTACCEACPTGARQLADLKNPKDPVHEFLRDHSVQVLKPHMATRSKVFYKDLDGSVR
ncbi:MAG: 4Fe-4S dicluster domain-containing protein [Bryobacterales bacterium]|nr:4Fe-4S dicluster domain-containing protein [Bryobacterales bacterium]